MRKIIALLFILCSLHSKGINPREEYIAFPDTNIIDYKEVSIAVEGNIRLNAWVYYPKPRMNNGRLIILSGGDSGNMSYWITHATILCQSGFTVITYDYRGFGKSSEVELDSKYLYYAEFVDDLLAVSEYARSNFPDLKTGYLGNSMGSLISILALQKEKEGIDFFVAEGLLIDPIKFAKKIQQEKGKVIKNPKGAPKSPEVLVQNISVPSLIFSGSDDSLINQCYDPSLLQENNWEIVTYEGGHLQALQNLKEKYYGDIYVKSIINISQRQ